MSKEVHFVIELNLQKYYPQIENDLKRTLSRNRHTRVLTRRHACVDSHTRVLTRRHACVDSQTQVFLLGLLIWLKHSSGRQNKINLLILVKVAGLKELRTTLKEAKKC